MIELRYGIGGDDPSTLEDVASVLGVSREQVRRLEREALARLSVEREIRALGEAV